jgi:glutamate dehydrogenase (NAD(P)+)
MGTELQQYFWSKKEVMGRLERALERSWRNVVRQGEKDRISNRVAAKVSRKSSVWTT